MIFVEVCHLVITTTYSDIWEPITLQALVCLHACRFEQVRQDDVVGIIDW